MKLLCAGEWQCNSPWAKQKYICNMHLHVLFCQRRFALLFPNPTSASLAIPHVRAATVILYTVPFYTIWFSPNLWICDGNEIGYLDMPAQLVYKITFSLFMASWSQFTHHQIKAGNLDFKITLLHTYTSSSRVSRYSINWCIYIYI